MRRVIFPLSLLVLIVVLYAPALGLGLIWDDPHWYQQGAGLSVGQIFTALPTFQFYRPLTILINRLFVAPNGVVNATLAHAWQLVVHGLAVATCAPALRALGVRRRLAALTSVLFAVCPLAFQAVAWQAPQQPQIVLALNLSVLAAQQFWQRPRRWGWLVLSGAVYAAALLIQESALPFVWLFFWLAWKTRLLPRSREERLKDFSFTPFAASRLNWLWPFFHLGGGLLYLLIWLQVPRQSGFTTASLRPEVWAYLLQGMVYPVAHGLAQFNLTWPMETWLVVFGGSSVILLRLQTTPHRWLALAWVGAALLPSGVGLAWEYVQVGERLLYPALPGICLLWAGVGLRLWETRWQWARALSAMFFASLIVFGLGQWARHLQLYMRGTQHLAAAITALRQTPQAAFVNFPDRLALRPAPYPLGLWGLTLAPVVQDLSDYAQAAEGLRATDRSLSVFTYGFADREAAPYAVNMRGSDSSPTTVLAAALWAEQVYVTDYAPTGALRLRAVGQAHPMAALPTQALAHWGETARPALSLLNATVQPTGLVLDWHCMQPQADTTIFVHIWQGETFIASVDGDSLGGLLPLWAWTPGLTLLDIRDLTTLDLPPGDYAIRIGLYNHVTAQRLPAFAPDGTRFPDDAVPVGVWAVSP